MLSYDPSPQEKGLIVCLSFSDMFFTTLHFYTVYVVLCPHFNLEIQSARNGGSLFVQWRFPHTETPNLGWRSCSLWNIPSTWIHQLMHLPVTTLQIWKPFLPFPLPSNLSHLRQGFSGQMALQWDRPWYLTRPTWLQSSSMSMSQLCTVAQGHRRHQAVPTINNQGQPSVGGTSISFLASNG